MISTSEQHAEHPVAGWNTQHKVIPDLLRREKRFFFLGGFRRLIFKSGQYWKKIKLK